MESKQEANILEKIWRYRKYLIVEPLLICIILPFGLLNVTVLNFNLEKACRVNLAYDPTICQMLLNKREYKIDCSGSTVDGIAGKNESLFSYEVGGNFNLSVCEAEVESQKLVSFMNAIRSPITSFFPVIVILFAGGWSDRSGLRKPCIILPLFGLVLSLTAHIVSAIFMDLIPMEFDVIMAKVIPSIFGGYMLFHVGIYSYLTETTLEKDRSYRFGIYTVFFHVMDLIGVSFSGLAYKYLGYIKIFTLCDILFVSGIVYVIFFIPEIERKEKVIEIADNKEIFTTNSCEPTIMPGESAKSYYRLTKPEKKKSFFADFFDPTSVRECTQVFLKKREHKGKIFLIISIVLTILIAAPDDNDFIYLFTMKSLKWNGDMYAAFTAYSMIIMMIGTAIITGVFIKILGISNAMAGFLVSLLSVISNFVKAFSTTSFLFYTSATLNVFSQCKGVVLNAITSGFVDKEEIGKIFSMLGIAAALGRCASPILYSFVYNRTLETFPGAIFLMSEIFLIPSVVLFAIVHFLVKKYSKNTDEEKQDITAGKPEEAKTNTNVQKS